MMKGWSSGATCHMGLHTVAAAQAPSHSGPWAAVVGSPAARPDPSRLRKCKPAVMALSAGLLPCRQLVMATARVRHCGTEQALTAAPVPIALIRCCTLVARVAFIVVWPVVPPVLPVLVPTQSAQRSPHMYCKEQALTTKQQLCIWWTLGRRQG
jgi:hypothetical protein